MTKRSPNQQNSSNLSTITAAPSGVLAVCLALALPVQGTENAPRKPFGEWAELPVPGQFSIRLWYLESEAYHIWAGNDRRNITHDLHGEDYGIDRMQGVVALEYGIARKWAADVNVGYGTVGTRSFNPVGVSESTSGLLDTSFGVRYQICHESELKSRWWPTLTFRAGAVVPGSYDKNFPFAPGNHSTAIETAILARKHFGWQGFGGYLDAFYRWMRTSGDDQYAVAVGAFQEIKSWTLNVGYRHFQQISGYDLEFNGVGTPLAYSPQVREISDAIEAGFNYHWARPNMTFGFYSRKTVDGSNTDSAFWLGGYVQIALGGKKK